MWQTNLRCTPDGLPPEAEGVGWRRGRDSNPRYPCEYAAFRVRCFQPLSHLSDGLHGASRGPPAERAAGTSASVSVVQAADHLTGGAASTSVAVESWRVGVVVGTHALENGVPGNLAGLPGMSIPCGFDAQGLPIGLQIVANVLREDLIFQVAHAYEQATDWHQRSPQLL